MQKQDRKISRQKKNDPVSQSFSGKICKKQKKRCRFCGSARCSEESGFQVDAGLLVEDMADVAGEGEVNGVADNRLYLSENSENCQYTDDFYLLDNETDLFLWG